MNEDPYPGYRKTELIIGLLQHVQNPDPFPIAEVISLSDKLLEWLIKKWPAEKPAIE